MLFGSGITCTLTPTGIVVTVVCCCEFRAPVMSDTILTNECTDGNPNTVLIVSGITIGFWRRNKIMKAKARQMKEAQIIGGAQVV